MAILRNKSLRRIALIILTLWSAGSFWFFNHSLFVSSTITLIAAISLFLIWTELSPFFLLIFLSFTSAYSLYGFLFFLNLPLWAIIIAALMIFGYLFACFEQKFDFLRPEQAIYLVIFGLIIAETFLFLSYLLIDPLNRSLIVALVSYLIAGFCLTIIQKNRFKEFSIYLIVFMIAYLAIVLTTSFGV